MIIIKKKSLDKIIWSIFLFTLIFNPPIIPRINLFLAAFSLFLIITKYRSKAKEIMGRSKINAWALSIVVSFLYVFIVPFLVSLFMKDIVNISHYRSLVNRFAVLFITIIPSCVLLLCVLDKKHYEQNFFIEILINAGLIESFFVITAFLSPAFKSILVNIMEKNTGNKLYVNNWYITVRSYGFAGTLVDLFGLGIAIIAGICFFYGITRKQLYVIFSILIAFDALVNARTGIILYIISVIFSMIYNIHKKNVKLIFKSIVGIITILGLSVTIYLIVSKNSATMVWIQGLVKSFRNLIENKSVQDSFNRLFNEEFWELPGMFRTIIGTAHSKYKAEGYSHSDVGYINDIWFAGLIGCSILYGAIFKFALNIYRKSGDIVLKFSAVYILICFLVFNIKGSAYGYNPGMASILTVIFVFNYYVETNRKET